jgi:hypothetical protein
MIGGHGHVTPRPDGAKARCGGPGLCVVCAREYFEKHGNWLHDEITPVPVRVPAAAAMRPGTKRVPLPEGAGAVVSMIDYKGRVILACQFAVFIVHPATETEELYLEQILYVSPSEGMAVGPG